MRLAAIAVLFAATFAADASSASTLAADPKDVSSVTAAAASSDESLASADLAESTVWYRDPIAIALALVALFALIDLSFMLTAHRHRTGSRASRPTRSA